MCIRKTFVYGKAVGGENFTDRKKETERLKTNFGAGVNSIIISPRRLGKTSLVKHVMECIDDTNTLVVFMDIYRCRTEYDFLEMFASTIIASCTTKTEQAIELAKEMILSIKPSISFGWGNAKVNLSLGIEKKSNPPEEILSLPERIAKKLGKNIVVCIDEFQQIGEMSDSIDIQKRLRSVWQHQEHVSYCLFGSKRHLMLNLFQNKRMPFYQFGDMIFIQRIPAEMWIPFICERFASGKKKISEHYAERICNTAENYSSYVQQIAWNVFTSTEYEVDDEAFEQGFDITIDQTTPLFVEQTLGLTAYQLNLLRAICSGYHKDFSKTEVTDNYPLGTRNNLQRILKALTERELIELQNDGTYDISDPLFKIWFRQNFL